MEEGGTSGIIWLSIPYIFRVRSFGVRVPGVSVSIRFFFFIFTHFRVFYS
jgi:hypothetical protein